MQHDLDPIQIGNEWVFPSGRRLPVISGGFDGEEGTGGDPAESAPEGEGESAPADDAPAEEAPAEGETSGNQDAVPGQEEAPEGSYVVPEDLEAAFPDADALVAEDERLATLFAELRPAATTTSEVAVLRSIRNGRTALAAESQRRIDEAARNAAELADLDAALPGIPTPGEAPAPAARAAAVRSAARTTPVAPAAGQPLAPAPAQPVTRVAAVAEAATHWQSMRADLGPVGGAASFRDLVNVGKVRGKAQETRPTILAATIATDVPEEMILTDSASHNEAAIETAVAAHRAARAEAAEGIPGVRSAAICDPSTIIRDAAVCGTDATPFRGALVNMQAGSGNKLAFQFRTPTSIAAAASAVGVWSETLQGDVDPTDPTTWKPCVAIACPSYTDAEATEITACYTIDAYTELSSPEAEADFLFALDRQYARVTESWWLREVDKHLHTYNFEGEVGALPDLIEAILTVESYGDYVERLDGGDYTAFGSPGLVNALIVDANKRAFGDTGSTAADVLGAVRAATQNDYVQLLDQAMNTNGTLPASPFPAPPAVGGGTVTTLSSSNRLNSIAFTIRLIDPSAFVAWNTGEGTFGDMITLDQARQNSRGLFKREFGGLMKPGCTPGYKINVSLCPDGSRGGFVAPGCPPTGFDDAGVAFTADPAD